MIGTESSSNMNNTLENWAWFLDLIGVRYSVEIERKHVLEFDPKDDEFICLVVDFPEYVKQNYRYTVRSWSAISKLNNVRIMFRKSTHAFVRIITDINYG